MKPGHLVLTGTLAIGLSLSGCKDKKTKLDRPPKNQQLSAKTLKAQIKGNMPEAAPVDSDKAEAAIAYMKAEGITWESQSGENGSYTFSNLNFAEEEVTIGELTVSGLQMMNEETPYASLFTMQDLTLEGGKIDEVVLMLPSADTMTALRDMPDDSDTAMENFIDNVASRLMTFSGGGYMQGFTIIEDSAEVGKLDFMGWNKDGPKMSGLIEGFKIDGTVLEEADGGDELEEIRIGHISVTNLDMGEQNKETETQGMALLMQSYMAVLNPYNRGYDSMALRDISVEGPEGFSVSVPSGDFWFTEDKGGVFHNKIEVPEFVMSMIGMEEEGAEIFGLDKMVFKFWSDLRIDRNQDNMKLLTGGLAMKDMMEMHYTYDVDGMSGYYAAVSGMFAEMGGVLDKVIADPTVDADTELEAISPQMEEKFMAELMKVTLNEFNIEIRDQSLLEKGFKLAAEEQGIQVADMKENAKTALNLGTAGASTAYQRTLMQDFIEAAQTFIDSSGAIKVTVKPQGGMSGREAMQLMEGQDMTDQDASMRAIDDMLKRMNIDFEHVPG